MSINLVRLKDKEMLKIHL